MAERVIDLIIEKKFEDRELRLCHTQSIFWQVVNLASFNDVQKYHHNIGVKQIIRIERR